MNPPGARRSTSITAVLVWHHRRYPLLQAADIYKLIHQGVFGPGHIIISADFARRALKSELTAVEVQSPKSKVQSQTEPEFEPIDPSGRLVRVNLRPMFGNWGQSPCGDSPLRATEWLVAALVESARRVKGEPAQMTRRLSAAVRWCRKNLPRQAAELERMAAQAGESGYPAFHHSPAYQLAYRPAYRVILRTCLYSRARLSRKGRTKREVRGEKLERRAGFGTSDT